MKTMQIAILAVLLKFDIPTPSPVAPPGVASKAQLVLNWIFWGAIVALVAALIVVGVTVAFSDNKGDGFRDGMRRVAVVLAGGTIVASATSIISAIMGV
ncbi:MAG: hypothetical protein Q4D73_06615 [Actinomycetaceae bacterium]|nr:hypothetical protein [Actinomycetaceae bacterium]